MVARAVVQPRFAAAYLRRSYVDNNAPGDISRQLQRDAIRRLATADGHHGDVVEYDDWGVSADVRKAERRVRFTALLADMEAGRISAVYAFDPDRLYRDPRDLIRLQDGARRHNVSIVTTAGRLAISDGDDPMAEAFAFITSVFGRLELAKTIKRARAGLATRRERGDVFGLAPYGFRHETDAAGRIVRVRDPEARVDEVLAAVRGSRSMLSAVKALNERGVPSPRGGVWHSSALRRVVAHLDPSLLPPRGASGRRLHGRSMLAQLIRCHCGQTMTPNVARGQLYCYRGNRMGVAAHGRAHVREIDLLPWVKAEAARLSPPMDAVDMTPSDSEERRAAIESRLRKATIAHIEGRIDDEQMEAEKARAEAGLDDLDTAHAIIAAVPQAIDWTKPPEDINRVLRTLWDHVQLDEQMHPVGAVWRLPDWRRGRRRRDRKGMA